MTEEIRKVKSIRAAYRGHCSQDFSKGRKTDKFRDPGSSRIGSTGGQTYTKRYRNNTDGYKNCDVTGNPDRHGISLIFSRQYIILAIQNRTPPNKIYRLANSNIVIQKKKTNRKNACKFTQAKHKILWRIPP